MHDRGTAHRIGLVTMLQIEPGCESNVTALSGQGVSKTLKNKFLFLKCIFLVEISSAQLSLVCHAKVK